MNLAEKLMKIDTGEFEKKKTEEITSKMLSDIIGEKTRITIQSVDPQRLLEISAIALDDEGNPVVEKSLEANSIVAAEGVINPPLKDQELIKHLGTVTPAMAALKLFKGEVNVIADRINKLSGFNIDPDKVDKEIKN